MIMNMMMLMLSDDDDDDDYCCCSQTQYGASPAILEGKQGPTEGAQRMPLLESRKLFASESPSPQ